MAILLSRLGRFTYRRGLLVLIAWILIAAGAVTGGVLLGGKLQDSFAIPGTESQQAIDRLAAVFPQSAGASAQIVVKSDAGPIDSGALKTEIDSVVASLGSVHGVEQALSPFSPYAVSAVSDDHSTAIISVQFDVPSESVTDTMLADVQATTSPLTSDGMQVAFGGQPFQQVDVGISWVEGLGVLFAAIVLIVAFGSLVAAGLPLISALLALGVSMGVVLTTAAFITVSSSTPMLALMIGLAVGIDYALFILSRHRAQLAAGMDPEDSAASAVATAGSSVVFAGVTVMIALAGLLIVGIPFLGLMGVAAAVAVLFAMLAATTLLPALMGLLGKRLVPKQRRPRSRRTRAADVVAASETPLASETVSPVAPKRTLGERWVGLVLRAPIVAVVAVVGILVTLAIPAFSLALALPDGGSQPKDTTARAAYDLVSEEFGPGSNGPLIVTVDITQTNDVMTDLGHIRDRIGALPGVASTGTPTPNPTVDTAIIQVVPTTGPSDPATTKLVERIRDLGPSIAAKYGTPIAVTGATAVAIDVSSRLDAALVPFGIVVVGLSILLLMMVFRSIVVPIKAALGYLLSVFAAFGVVVAVFQWGWGSSLLGVEAGPILSFMPILLMAILFGLAMDYEVFLVSGMREEFVHTGDARRSIVRGFRGAARVVTAAALIMIFVFAAFVPDGAGVIKVIALGLAVGIAVDAFLVRMTLVPAIMALFGKHAWYLPKWLDRILPNVDIEGEGLRVHVADLHWATAEREAGHAISLDALVAGDRDPSTEPVTASIPAGAFAFAGGAAAPRRLLAATVAGRLTAVSGRAQVAGHPVPTDAARVSGLVALGDLGGGRGEVGVTLGALLSERIRATGPWYRGVRVRRRSEAWLDRIRGALAAAGRSADAVSSGSVIATMTQLDRAVALAAVALSERTPVVLLELADPMADADIRAFLTALDRLAPATTTVVVGSTQARGFDAIAPDLSRATVLVASTAEGAVR